MKKLVQIVLTRETDEVVLAIVDEKDADDAVVWWMNKLGHSLGYDAQLNQYDEWGNYCPNGESEYDVPVYIDWIDLYKEEDELFKVYATLNVRMCPRWAA